MINVYPPTLPLAFAAVDWAVVGVYLVFVTGVGVWFSRRRPEKDSASYFLGGRSMPGWVVTLSLLATSLSAATYVGAPDQAFHGNLTFLILYLGNVAAVVLVAMFFVPRLWSAGTTTIYGYLGRRFGPGAQRAAGATFVFGRLLASGSRLFMAATPLFVILTADADIGRITEHRLELIGCVLLVGVVGTAYALLGGIRAVMWTDAMQLVLIFGAAGVTAFVVYRAIDLPPGEIVALLRAAETPAGSDKLAVFSASADPRAPFTVWTALIGNLIFFAAVFGTDHDIAQRFMTARSVKSGARSVIASQAVGLAATAMFMVIGLLLWVYYRHTPGVRPPAEGVPVYVTFLAFELPPVVAGLAVAGLFAAAQSTMDSATNSLAASAIHDVWRPDSRGDTPRTPHAPRTAPSTLVSAAAGTALTLFAIGCVLVYDPADQTFIDFALSVMTLAVCGLLGVFLCAMFTTRGTSASVAAGLAVGFVIMLASQPMVQRPVLGGVWFHWFWGVPVATLASLVVCALPRGKVGSWDPTTTP